MMRQKLRRDGSFSPSNAGSIVGKSSGFELYKNQTNMGLGAMDIIKQRLAYDWKGIYRTVVQMDTNNSGSLTSNDFQLAV
jgi:hypothetical protein